ncbi:MAG: DUF1850 domain-containing protein [Clostridium sp.]|nr:DUF1850 domain-containing protein [Clostridium sp.]
MEKRGTKILLAFLLLGGLVSFQLRLNLSQQILLLKDQDTNKIYGQWFMEEESLFSLSFIHSVNKSPVKDEIMVKDGILHAHKVIYSGFGAGVQTELNPGELLTYDENHQMVISNIKTTYENLNLIVGTVSDHVLEIQGTEISLRELCGKNAAVTFIVTKGRGDGES